MNKAQIRHTQSIGRHLNIHIQSMKNIADRLQQMTERDGAEVQPEWVERHLNDDLAHYWKKMQSVITDMLPGLEQGKD